MNDLEKQIIELQKKNDQLNSSLQVANQTILKVEAEKGALIGEKQIAENLNKAVRHLMEQLKEQYIQEQLKVLNLEDAIQILKANYESDKNILKQDIVLKSNELNALKEQTNIHVMQILKKTQAVSYTESLARNIFNIMFSMLSDAKVVKKIKEFVSATLTLKELVTICITHTGLDLEYDDVECQALRKHVEKFDISITSEEERVTNMYQTLWLLAKVIVHIK